MPIVALNSIYDDFKITTISLFHSDDKDLTQIQLIVTSTKVANLAK